MSDYKQQVTQLMRTAHGKSDGDVALLEEAARLADVHGDPALGMTVRIRLINAANWSGNHELVLVAFTWCLAQLDRDEHLRPRFEREVLWYYKWVVESLADYAQVSREQIDRSFTDMSNRYAAAGYGMGPLHKCRAYASLRLGDIAAHRTAREQWLKSPREDIADCRACQTDSAVEFDLEAGDLEGAVKTARPIIEGVQRCAEIPCLTAGRLLLPLLKLGSTELAETLHRANLRQTLSTRDFLASIGPHIAYLALQDRIPAAIKIFETGIPWLIVTRRTWERFLFVEHSAVLFERMAATSDEPIQIKIPAEASFYNAGDTYRPSTIAKAIVQMRQEFEADFNRRNQNTYLSERHQRFRELVDGIAIH